MQVGDLVWVHSPETPKGWIGDEQTAKLAVYLGQKTFDGKYTCSMVHFLVWESPLSQPRPVQTDLLEAVNETENKGRRLSKAQVLPAY